MNRELRPYVPAHTHPPGKNKYDHAEAFMKMLYQCENEKCRNLEVLWNSRDGVTPFTINCPICKEPMSHIFWQLGARFEDFTPSVGTRIFVTHTRESYQEDFKEYVDEGWNRVAMPMSGHWKTKEEAVEALTKDFQDGTPRIITVDEKYLKEIEK